MYRPKLPTADELLPYLRRIDANRTYSNHGELVQELEARLASRFGLLPGSVVSASSGTAALLAAIIAVAGRAPEDRPLAVVPAFTFAATAAAVELAGYRPFVVDVDPITWSLDPDRVSALADIHRVGVVVPVAPFGRPLSLAPWRRFQDGTGVPVVVDAAAAFHGASEAPDALLGETPVCLSFHATKSFTTGEGGCVVSTDAELTARVVQALNFGFLTERNSMLPGTNGKLSEYHAAVGLAELDRWQEQRDAFLAVAERYRRGLSERGLADAFVGPPQIGLNYALFSCSDADQARATRGHLHDLGVDHRQWYSAGLHRQTYYAAFPREKIIVAERLASCLIGIPVAPDLPAWAAERVIAALSEAATAVPAGVRRPAAPAAALGRNNSDR